MLCIEKKEILVVVFWILLRFLVMWRLCVPSCCLLPHCCAVHCTVLLCLCVMSDDDNVI